ncbi:leucyl-cystinyl aminopeptidase-like [Convolutriloba macropyga]|uniref:leucyl-cystinyl aminopeptidase-like n=1 Tax=Convolutriloba macropyga TaxID=536237 RepID=UPI003F524F91
MNNAIRVILFLLSFHGSESWEFFDPKGTQPFGDQQLSDFYRLPDDFEPISQHISLKYSSEGRKFIGNTSIVIEKRDNTSIKSVTLNALNLTFTQIMATYGNVTYNNLDFKIDRKTEQLSVELPFNFTTNVCKYTLEICFESQINGPGTKNSKRELKAAYWLINEQNRTNGIATQFEASLARTVFPCFDEPKFRTVFSLDLDINELGSDYSAFSNEGQLSSPEEAVNGIFRFGETKPIPSYLVAFAVLNMSEYTEALNFKHRSMPIRIIIPSSDLDDWEKYNHSSAVLHAINYSLSRIEDQFKFNWSMSSKLDIVFVDHAFGGMENTGLITINRQLVTYDDSYYVISTVIHELVHQWTGGVLTCDWWSNVWLNEGITTYVEKEIARELISDGRLDSNADWSNPLSKHVSFKIVRYVESDLAIHDRNSTIQHSENYSLGSMVTSMLNTAMNDTLLPCLGTIFQKFTYQSLSSKFVMDELTKCPLSDLNATDFMRFWLLADDIPILKISILDKDTIEFSYNYFCSIDLLNVTECPDLDRTFEPEFAVILRDSENKILQKFERIYQNNSKYAIEFDAHENKLFFANAYDPIKYIVQYNEDVYGEFFDWVYEEFNGTENKLPSYYTAFIFDMIMLSSSEIIDLNWLYKLLQEQSEILETLDNIYDKFFLERELEFYSNCLNSKLFSNLPQNETDLLTYSCMWRPETVLCGGDQELQKSTQKCEKWYQHHGESFKLFLLNQLQD